MKFQYFTFFLNPVATLFEDKRAKIDILSEILQREEPVSYEKRGTSLAYRFNKKEGDYIVGKIGRKSKIKRHLSPEKNFKSQDEENWPFCDVVFYLSSDHEKGQKIAFEYKAGVFVSPNEQLKYFSEKINETLMTYGYVLSINPVTEEQEFWKIVNDNKGKIEKLSFTFNAPNLFDLDNTLNEDLKNLSKEYNINKTTVELENSDGQLSVPENSELVKQGVEYVARGGGQYSFKLKGRGRRVLKSSNNIVTKNFDFENLDIVTNDGEFAKETLKQIFE